MHIRFHYINTVIPNAQSNIEEIVILYDRSLKFKRAKRAFILFQQHILIQSTMNLLKNKLFHNIPTMKSTQLYLIGFLAIFSYSSNGGSPNSSGLKSSKVSRTCVASTRSSGVT